MFKTPAPPLASPKTKPTKGGKYDGDNPGPAGQFKRTKSKSGPPEKIYETV